MLVRPAMTLTRFVTVLSAIPSFYHQFLGHCHTSGPWDLSPMNSRKVGRQGHIVVQKFRDSGSMAVALPVSDAQSLVRGLSQRGWLDCQRRRWYSLA